MPTLTKEFENKNPAKITHLFFVLCLMSVVVFVLWAANGQLDVASIATGEVSPASQVKKIQHLEGGIIHKILIKEGDHVKKGQVLVTLASVVNASDVDELMLSLRALKIKMIRLEAEVYQKQTLVIPEELEKIESVLVNEARHLFSNRQRRLSSQIKVQQELLSQYQYESEEIASRLAANKNIIGFLNEQVGMSKKLLEHSLSNRMNHVNLLKERAQLKGKIAEDKANEKRIASRVREAKSRINLITDTFLEESRMEFEETLGKHRILTQRLVKNQDSLRRTVLKAPEDGIIKQLYVAAKGDVLVAGGTVADIVPSDDRLIIEAKLPVTDISYIQKGQKAMVRLASMDGFRFGHIDSQVKNISPDTLVSEDGVPYYKIMLMPKRAYFQKNHETVQLVPGMMVQCQILTGKRTILEYLLKPFNGILSLAMRER